LYYSFCMQGEYRDFFEVFPFLTIICGYALFKPLEVIKQRI